MKKTKIRKIIIIEGIWGSGKTTLAKELAKKLNGTFLKEPNHIMAGIKSKNINHITRWYLNYHQKNFDSAVKLALDGETIIIERSILYNIAFQRVILKDKNTDVLFKNFIKSIKNIKKISDINIKFIYLKPKNLQKKLALMKTDKNVKRFAEICLLRDIDKELVKLLSKLSDAALIELQIK